MRYMLDTCIVSFYYEDKASLDFNVLDILEDYNNQFYISAETVKELIVLYRTKNLFHKLWKSEEDMVKAIVEEQFVEILPIDKHTLITLSKLRLNVSEDHKDPSDHTIIAHAITLKMPLISSDHKFLFYRNQGLNLVYNER